MATAAAGPTPTPTATPASCPVNFATSANYVVGDFPFSVAVGDFNGDGNKDVVLCNFWSDDIWTALGSGTGTFGSAVSFPAGSLGPVSVAVADFNADGHQDLAFVARTGGKQGKVAIVLGDGTGHFGAPTNYVVGGSPQSVVVGEFNADGKPDVAVANQGSNDITVRLGDGAGGLGSGINFVAADHPLSIVQGDFNGDGKQDLAAANFDSANVSILLGNGNGLFGTATNFAAGSFPSSLAVGDFNADGKQDLVAGHYYSANVSLLSGDGAGHFSAPVDFAAGDRSRAVALGDFNGDGNPDVAAANHGSPNVSILLSDGAGHFSSPIDFLAGNSPQAIAVADFNGDSRPDLAVANELSDEVSILLRECSPRPTPTITYFAVVAPTSVRLNDFFSFQVTAKDQFNTTVSGYPGTVHFTSSSCCPNGLPPDSPLANGTGSFITRLSQLGTHTITATDTSDPSITGTSNPIFVRQPGTPTPTPSPTPTPTAAPTPTPIPGTLLDTITGADYSTTVTGNPRTYMGSGWTNNAIPAGSTSISITGLTLSMYSATTQAYTNVVARIQFWNNHNQTTTPVFTDASGPLITVDLGPQNLTANTFTAIPVTLATPLVLPGGPGTNWGFAQNFRGDTGAGPVDTANLTSRITSHSNGLYSSGQITTGTAPKFGSYANFSGRLDFNFNSSDSVTHPALNAQGIGIVIFGTAQGGGTPTPTPTPTASPSPSPTATASASPSPTGTISPPAPAQSLNLSSRLLVQTGDGVGIAGVIISGSAPKRVILRAVHCQVCIPEVSPLADPMLELHPSSGGATIINDNWRDTQEAEIIGTGLVPDNESDSAIVATLSPGNQTAIVRGKNNTSGVALIEVYDLDQAAASKLANISTRAFVSTGGDILIAGFILGNGTLPDNVIVRGIGPSLGGLGVANALADPRLELRDSNGTLVRSNNNWQDDPAQAALLSAAGLAPSNTLESGIAAPLSPGQYTALLAGSNNGTGVGLVEVYDLGNP